MFARLVVGVALCALDSTLSSAQSPAAQDTPHV